ncbi:MAG: hypothetical protein WBG92_05860 [Thiohalocapsa sp.]
MTMVVMAVLVVVLSLRLWMRIFFVARIAIVRMIVMIRVPSGNADGRVVAIMRFVIPMCTRGGGVVVVDWIIVFFGSR